MRAGRDRHDRQRRSARAYFGQRTATSSRTSSTSASRDEGRWSGSRAGARRTGRRRSCARRSGFAAGSTRYLRAGRAKLPDPTCRGKAGCARSAIDMYRRFYQLGLRASSGNFLDEIVAAKPPPAGAAAATTAIADPRRSQRARPAALGSNAYGIGRDGARGERSLVLGNPHFPWQGSERWYELHLTIPGKLDAIGAALQGVPAVNIGFNRGVAWTHTVSTARRFSRTSWRWPPGDPTVYLLDGRELKMRTAHGAGRVRGGRPAHTFYETVWGPVVALSARRPDLDPGSTLTRSPTSTPTTSGSRPVGGVGQGAVGRRCAQRGEQGAGQPVGEHDHRRRPAAPTTPTTARAEPRRRPCAVRRAANPMRRCCWRRAGCCSTARGGVRVEERSDALGARHHRAGGLPHVTEHDYA